MLTKRRELDFSMAWTPVGWYPSFMSASFFGTIHDAFLCFFFFFLSGSTVF